MSGRAALSAALALVAASPAAAQDLRISPALRDARAGIFCAENTGERRPAPGTVSGYVETLAAAELRAETGTLPLVPGLSFGFQATAAGAPIDGAVMTIRHPPFPGLGATEQTMDLSFGTGPTTYLYSFDLAYEMVPGPWSMEVRADGEVILQARFQAVPAESAPALASLCAPQGLVS